MTTESAADQPYAVPDHLRAEQLTGRMGIELVSSGRDEVVGRMPVAGNRQPFGLLHGGASAVLAETLGSVLAALNVMPERFPVGLELSCTHHRAATDGWVTGTARPIHMGRSTSTSEIVLVDEQGRRTCTARLTCLHRESSPAGPPGRGSTTAGPPGRGSTTAGPPGRGSTTAGPPGRGSTTAGPPTG